MGVQEQGDGRCFDKQMWQSVPVDDLTPDDDKGGFKVIGREEDEMKGFQGGMNGNMDGMDSVGRKKYPEPFQEQPQLYTFKKVSGHPVVMYEDPAVLRTNPEVMNGNPQVMISNPEVMNDNPLVLNIDPWSLKDDPLVSRFNPKVMNDEPLVLRDEPLVLRDDPVVLRDDPVVLRVDPEVMNGDPVVLRGDPVVVMQYDEINVYTIEI